MSSQHNTLIATATEYKRAIDDGAKMNIGIIGRGFVGNAVYENLKDDFTVTCYDKDKSKTDCNDVRELCHSTDIIFVCLPTPMRPDGSCDLSIIFGAMAQVAHWYDNNIVVIKSTIPPGTCERILRLHPELKLVFSPEFLTERNSIEDFKTCSRVIFGGNQPDTQACVDLFKIIYPDKTYRQTDHRTAEVVKYYINTFLACKISFANEVKQICDSIEVEYNDVKELALLDERIGKTHLNVPGHDGNCGFGGTCFPKDLNSFIHFAELNKIDPIVLKSVWSKNLEVRINKDWESMPGRAVSKGESNEQ